MRQLAFLVAATIFLLMGQKSAIAQSEALAKILEKLPAGANSIMVADLVNVRDSDVATKNQWFESHNGRMDSGIGFLPVGTDGVVLASNMDLEAFRPNWTAGLLLLDNVPSLASITQMTYGTLDEMSGTDLVETSTDLFVFQTPGGLATFSPANRQMLAPWFTALKEGRKQTLSDFLQSSIAGRPSTSGLFITWDMTNLISPASVAASARDSDVLKQNGIDAEAFATLLSSSRGAAIDVSFSTSINFQAKIDFAQDPAILGPIAKELMIEVLGNHGVDVTNSANWQARVSGNQLVYSGELSTTGLRRLISLFDAPDTHITTDVSSVDTSQNGVIDATRQYYQSVSGMITELRKDIGVGGQSGYKYGKWFETYADKIDNLNPINVDPDMLDFGAAVSQAFRQVNLQIINSQQTAEAKNTKLMTSGRGSPAYRYRRSGYGYRGYGYGYAYPWRYHGGWGYWGWGDGGARARGANNLQIQAEKEAINKEARLNAGSFGAQVFTDLQQREGELIKLMAQRYPDAFKQ